MAALPITSTTMIVEESGSFKSGVVVCAAGSARVVSGGPVDACVVAFGRQQGQSVPQSSATPLKQPPCNASPTTTTHSHSTLEPHALVILTVVDNARVVEVVVGAYVDVWAQGTHWARHASLDAGASVWSHWSLVTFGQR